MSVRGAPVRRPTAPRPPVRVAWLTTIPGPTDPLPDQVQQFLDWLRIQKNRPPTTVRAYRQDIAKFVAFMRTRPLGSEFCAAINRGALRRYQIELADVLPHPRTRARALVAVRRFLAYAYDEGWTEHELSRQVVVPTFTVGDPHPVATHLVPKLLAALPHESMRDLRDRALINLLITTGCRISEALALNRTELRPDGFRVLGKGGKHRTVYCTADSYAAIEQYLAARGPDASDAVFISVSNADMPKGRVLPGNRLTTDGARRALTALRHRFAADPTLYALIDGLRTPHAARHTAATTLLEATDGDVRLVQEVLGHATLETLRVYTEITDKRKRAAYERLGDYLKEQ